MAVPEELKENYWKTVRRTRTSGRIAGSVVERVEEQWKKFDESVVRQALEIHISHYPGYKENYTLGIMRNLQREKDSACGKKQNRFNQFEQRGEMDFEALEKKLLANHAGRQEQTEKGGK